MNKIIACSLIAIMILTVGAFADTREDIKDYIREKGVIIEDKDIVEINFSDLPYEVDIETIQNTSIQIYEVNYSAKPLFVITSSDSSFQAEEPSPVCETKLLLHFGSSEGKSKSDFLNMASEVQSSLEKGYVMIRSGSITGISTNLEVVRDKEGEEVEIIIYKNGKEIGFRNVLSADSSGIKVDYDTQSKGIVNFKEGDIISVYLNLGDGVSVTDVTTMIEITN